MEWLRLHVLGPATPPPVIDHRVKDASRRITVERQRLRSVVARRLGGEHNLSLLVGRMQADDSAKFDPAIERLKDQH